MSNNFHGYKEEEIEVAPNETSTEETSKQTPAERATAEVYNLYTVPKIKVRLSNIPGICYSLQSELTYKSDAIIEMCKKAQNEGYEKAISDIGRALIAAEWDWVHARVMQEVYHKLKKNGQIDV